MNILALPPALALTMNLTICLIVISSKPRDMAHQLFGCFVLSFATWNLGELIMINSLNPAHAILGVKIIFIGLVLAPLFFLYFSFFFPLKIETPWARGKRFVLLSILPVASLVSFFSVFRIDIQRFQELSNVFYYGIQFEEPLIFLIFIGWVALFSGVCIYWGIRNLLQSLRRTKIPKQKLQIKYLIFGMISMAIVGTGINLCNHFLKLGWPLFFLASLYSILVSIFFAIALIKYRLLDIHLIIRGGIVYSSVSALILAIYILIVKNIGEAISEKAYGRSIVVESALILALVLMFRPIQRKVGDWIDQYFYMERVRFRTKLTEFSRTLTELVDLEEVACKTVEFIDQTFHVNAIAFLFLKSEDNEYRMIYGIPPQEEMRFSSHHPLVERILLGGRTIDLEHLRQESGNLEEIGHLIEKGWVVVSPLILKEKLLGFLLLGSKRSQKDFTVEELELIEAFSNQATLALSRTLVYREMSLKDRQIMQAEKMAAIGELAAGIAHEIRNPLGIITGSVETLQKREDPKIRAEMMDYILEESKRIDGLIGTFLDFSKPKEPQRIRCDLLDVLEKTLFLISPQAHTHHVEIQKEVPKKSIWVKVDMDQIKQAFMNLCINALEAMPQGGVLRISVSENRWDKVMVSFSDTGKGIPKEVRTRIFEPFFTTKERGTGLGLFIAHRIITQHGGEIALAEGSRGGSTFMVSLPLEREN
ncbi:MAG: ATP-binding protein [Thermodesulfobacteriota bacterium]